MASQKKKLYYIYCPVCEYRGKADRYKSGFTVLLEIILFLCFILPWVVYHYLFPKKFQCPKCGNTKVNRLASYYTKECPYCQKRVTDRDPVCPQCGRTLAASEKYGRSRVSYTKSKSWK